MATIKKLFLIDDDKVFNFINSKIISKSFSSIDVITFEFAKIALEELVTIFETNTSDFPDIIFLDINMPEMDGWEFLDELIKLPVEILEKFEIIMLTSSIDPKDIEKSKTYKVVKDFISKPLTPDKLNQFLAG